MPLLPLRLPVLRRPGQYCPRAPFQARKGGPRCLTCRGRSNCNSVCRVRRTRFRPLTPLMVLLVLLLMRISGPPEEARGSWSLDGELMLGRKCGEDGPPFQTALFFFFIARDKQVQEVHGPVHSEERTTRAKRLSQ